MKDRDFKKYLYYGATAVAVIAVCIIFWHCVQNWSSVSKAVGLIMGIAAPIIYGAILAYLLSPVYDRTCRVVKRGLGKILKKEKHRNTVARFCGTAASVIVIIVVVASLFQMLIPQLIDSLIGIRDSFPAYLQNLYTWIQKVLADNQDIEKFVLTNLQASVTFMENWLEKTVVNMDFSQLTNFLNGVSSGLWSLLIFVKNWLIGLIVMVYLLNMKDHLKAQSKKIVYGIFNLKWANAIVNEMRFVNQVFGGFIIGKLLDSLIIGIICFFATSLMKMPFAMLISVIVGVTNIIPFFGPFIGAIPSGFLVLLVSPVKCLYFLLWILLLQQFDGNILGPKILGDSTGLSSFWVLFSILLFGGLFGFVGMIIAVPAFAVIYDFISRTVNRSLKHRQLSLKTSDYEDLDHIDEHDGTFIR